MYENFSLKVSISRIEITNIQQAITNMHNMVMKHRGKKRSKPTIGIETQLKQVDLHLVFFHTLGFEHFVSHHR